VTVYDPENYRKHKRPEGWGSLCPDDLPEAPQALLDSGVLVEGQIYNISGAYAVCAQEHRPNTWHGYPIPWSRLPREARLGLIRNGRLDDTTYRKALRKRWGSEFDR
jgi:hypothetical protein